MVVISLLAGADNAAAAVLSPAVGFSTSPAESTCIRVVSSPSRSIRLDFAGTCPGTCPGWSLDGSDSLFEALGPGDSGERCSVKAAAGSPEVSRRADEADFDTGAADPDDTDTLGPDETDEADFDASAANAGLS